MKKKLLRVTYLGNCQNNLNWLVERQEEYDLCSIALINELFDESILNPLNYIYVTILKLKLVCRKNVVLNFFLLTIFNLFKYLFSGVFKQFERYLYLILKYNLLLIDTKSDSYFTGDDSQNIDLFIVNDWVMIGRKLLAIPKYGCLNIHPSDLPQYRGALPTLWSLKNKDKISAVSFMKLVPEMDQGGVCHKVQFSLDKDEDSLSIETKIWKIINENLSLAIEKIIQNEVMIQSSKEVSYTEKFMAYTKINPQLENLVDVQNKIKMYPFFWKTNLTWFEFRGKRIRVKSYSTPITKLLTFTLSLKDDSLHLTLFKDIPIMDSFLILRSKLFNELSNNELNLKRSKQSE